MHPFWKGIRGETLRDTAAFLLNRAVYALRSRLGSRSPAHWLVFPFHLMDRRYYIPYLCAWVDAGALLWGLLHAENPDFPLEWLECLQRGRYGMDIGSHRGYWLLLHAHRLAPESQVVALEPFWPNFRWLVRNLSENHFFAALPFPLAAGEASAALRIKADATIFGAIGNARLTSEQADAAYSTRIVRIDDLVDMLGWPGVDWVKMDIEGAEVQALRGAERILQRSRPHLWIEIHGTFAEVEPILRKYDYALAGEKWYEVPRQGMGHIWAIPAEEQRGGVSSA